MVYVRTWCPDWRLLSSVPLGHGDFLGQVQDATGLHWKAFGFLGHLVAQIPPKFSINTPYLLFCPRLFRDEAWMLGRAPVCGTGSFPTCVDTSLCSPIPLPQRGTPRKTRRPWKSLRSSHRKRGLCQTTWQYLSRWVRTHTAYVPFSVCCATCNPVTLMSPDPRWTLQALLQVLVMEGVVDMMGSCPDLILISGFFAFRRFLEKWCLATGPEPLLSSA